MAGYIQVHYHNPNYEREAECTHELLYRKVPRSPDSHRPAFSISNATWRRATFHSFAKSYLGNFAFILVYAEPGSWRARPKDPHLELLESRVRVTQLSCTIVQLSGREKPYYLTFCTLHSKSFHLQIVDKKTAVHLLIWVIQEGGQRSREAPIFSYIELWRLVVSMNDLDLYARAAECCGLAEFQENWQVA